MNLAVAPMPCSVVERCGGCKLMRFERAEQLRRKSENIARASLLAGFTSRELNFHGAAQDLGYRNRIRLRVAPQGQLSFFNDEKDASCVVLETPLRSLLAEALAHAAQCPEIWRRFRWVELRALDLDGRPALYCVPNLQGNASEGMASEGMASDAELTLARSASWPTLTSPQMLIHVAGSVPTERIPCQRVALNQNVFALVPVGSFMQVNSEVNRALISSITELAATLRARTFADVFCGAGNFSLPLLALGLGGSGVELDAVSIDALRRAATLQNLDARGFVAEHADACLERWCAQGRRFDLVIADPPRAGLKELAPQLAALCARDLIFCCCSPKNLSADLGALRAHGFELVATRLFDMFPHTEHVEAVFHLRRSRLG